MPKTLKLLTFEERKLLEKYAKTKMSCIEISKIIGRSKNCVTVEYRIAGGRQTYDAQKAHENANEKRELKYKRLSERNRGRVFSKNHLRLASLEMQIEILHDTIKGLLEK
jgi:IS30 family transposase